MTISVIIPALDEASQIGAAVGSARGAGVEVLVVDGGSADRTDAAAREAGACVIQCPPGRAVQMNHGVAHSRGDVLLFLHADTTLPPGYAAMVERTLAPPGVVAGAFALRFDRDSRALRLVAWGANLRSRWRQLPYGDQALFMRRETFERVDGYRPLPVMEDYDMVRRLRRLGRVALAPAAVCTSSRGCETRSPWSAVARHQLMIGAYHLGLDPRRFAPG